MKARLFLVLLLLVALAVPSLAIPRIHLRRVSVGAGYSHFSGPYYPYYPGYWPGYSSLYPGSFYPPGYWDPYWSPYGSPIAYTLRDSDKGEVHLKDAAPQAEVYIDGAYAGIAKDLRTLWLAPGAYNLELRSGNQTPVQKKIYVLTGKTVNVRMAEVKP
jgi:hypothetical protein